ncbi:hypothetical protein [Allocoleopsis sp.]|uniref:hypothetical protein n=1 Tax=Allocoleopsis sp. TaxID=3088169 RepID=UPI002FD30558
MRESARVGISQENNLTLERRGGEIISRRLREEILKSMNQGMNQVISLPFLHLCTTLEYFPFYPSPD